nr:uncharacterized protein LOC114924683 [Arachis hypogaea]
MESPLDHVLPCHWRVKVSPPLILSSSRLTLFSSALSTRSATTLRPTPSPSSPATTVAYSISLPFLLFFFSLSPFLLNPLYATPILCAKPNPGEKPQCNPAAAELCAAATPRVCYPSLSILFLSLTQVIECTDITGSDDTDLVDELSDHSCLAEDEIPRVWMQFEHLKLA